MTVYGTRTSTPERRPLSDWQRDRMSSGFHKPRSSRVERVLLAAVVLGGLMTALIGFAS